MYSMICIRLYHVARCTNIDTDKHHYSGGWLVVCKALNNLFIFQARVTITKLARQSWKSCDQFFTWQSLLSWELYFSVIDSILLSYNTHHIKKKIVGHQENLKQLILSYLVNIGILLFFHFNSSISIDLLEQCLELDLGQYFRDYMLLYLTLQASRADCYWQLTEYNCFSF